MHESTRRIRNGEEIRDAILVALATNPLSTREIFARVNGCIDGTEASRRALDMLIASGLVTRHGCRMTFDFGTEILFRSKQKEVAANVTCHTHDVLVYEYAKSDC